MPYTLNKLSSARYTGQLVDETGSGFGAVTSLTLSLYKINWSIGSSDPPTITIINGRNQQNILNANQVTLNPLTGALQWDLLPLDNPILDNTLNWEEHRALFVAKWGGVTKQMNHEIILKVINLRELP